MRADKLHTLESNAGSLHTPYISINGGRLDLHASSVSSIPDIVRGSLAGFNCAAAALNETRHVVGQNQSFAGCLNDGMAVRHGVLMFDDRAKHHALAELVVHDDCDVAPLFMTVARPSGRRSLLVQARPLRIEASPQRLILMLVLDPHEQIERRCVAALISLGLTPAEARTAVLIAEGASPKDVASVIKIQTSTVRSQIKAIYAKLDVCRQSELTRLVHMVNSIAT
jgi:DNA-binding CsgD family transcriptional regulator